MNLINFCLSLVLCEHHDLQTFEQTQRQKSMETHFNGKFYILKHLVIHFSFYVVSLYIYWK